MSKNSQFLIRGGFIDKLTAGVYSYLPLGFLVLKKIEKIIREEIKGTGAQELLLPALHPKENWQKTGRWKYPEMFKLKNRSDREMSLGWTHEEIITPLVAKFVSSYKDLPFAAFQIQSKFRDERRAKSGILRGVEFIMKDLYSFHQDEEDLDRYYSLVKKAYFKIFERCGLSEKTFLTLASGGSFSQYSHEFQMLTEAGEDEIFICEKCRLAVNREIIEEENNQCPKCKNKNLVSRKAIEIGNIFKLGERYTDVFGLKFKDEEGKEKNVKMGCYGIGLGRLMGAAVEAHNDQNGIIWPKEISPFSVHLICLGDNVAKSAEKIYSDLEKEGVEVLYDDRDKSAGEKFIESDLIGIPLRVVVSEKTEKEKCVELKKRGEKTVELIKADEIKKYV
jgi:prolyl-tRNA synthetase